MPEPTSSTRPGAIGNEQLLTVAAYLSRESEAGRVVYLRPELSGKLADALIECVNRGGAV